MKNETIIQIHRAIHDPKKKFVNVGPVKYDVEQTKKGFRYVNTPKIKFVEQNRCKLSYYAKKARLGDKITWGIYKEDEKEPWILVINDKIIDRNKSNIYTI